MRSIKSDLNKCLSSNIELRTYFFVKLISTLIFTKHYTLYTLHNENLTKGQWKKPQKFLKIKKLRPFFQSAHQANSRNAKKFEKTLFFEEI